MTVFNNEIFSTIKTQKAKEYFADNHGHNILIFFDTLQNFLFTTSETKRGY